MTASAQRDPAPWPLSTGCAPCRAAFQLDDALRQTGHRGQRCHQLQEVRRRRRGRSPDGRLGRFNFNHALQLAMLQAQSLGGAEYTVLPSQLRSLPPTRPPESANAHDVTSASARSVGKSSACQPEPQAVSWWSSSVLRPLSGLDRRYQLRPGSVMQAYRKLTAEVAVRNFLAFPEECMARKSGHRSSSWNSNRPRRP